MSEKAKVGETKADAKPVSVNVDVNVPLPRAPKKLPPPVRALTTDPCDIVADTLRTAYGLLNPVRAGKLYNQIASSLAMLDQIKATRVAKEVANATA